MIILVRAFIIFASMVFMGLLSVHVLLWVLE